MIPQESFTSQTSFYVLDIDIQVQFASSLSLLPGDCWLALAHQAEFDEIVLGSGTVLPSFLLNLTPSESGKTNVIIKGRCMLNGSANGLLNGNQGTFVKYESPDPYISFPSKAYPMEFFNSYGAPNGSGPSSPGVSENMHICVIPISGPMTVPIQQILGSINFYKIPYPGI